MKSMYHSVSDSDVATAKEVHIIATRVLKTGKVIYAICKMNKKRDMNTNGYHNFRA